MIPYIIKALQKDDSICVNDLGTFSLHYVPANINGKVVTAPHNTITFDAHSGSADYAFTDLVCFEKKCLITQASSDITRWVEELKQALNHNKSVSFEGFGTFSLNDKGKISFSCDHIPELNIEFEGMQDLHTDNLWSEERPETEEQRPETEEQRTETEDRRTETEEQRTETEEQRTETEDGRPEAEEEEPVIYRSTLWEDENKVESVVISPEVRDEVSEVEEAPKTETIMETSEEVMPEEDVNGEVADKEEVSGDSANDGGRPRRSRWWLWLLLVALLLATLGAAGYLLRYKLRPIYDNVKDRFAKKEKVEAPTETETIEVITPIEETVEDSAEEIVEEVVEEAPAYTPIVVKRTADNKYPYIRYEAGHYYAIVGSLPTEGDAERHIRQRNLDPYEPKMVLQNGVGNIRVCIGVFDSEEEAEEFAKGTGLKYWILK